MLLIATTTGYQTRQFEDAAARLGVDIVYATDRCDHLDDPWRDGAIPVRFHEEEGKWWPSGSVAQNIVGLCLLQNDMFNLMVAGSMATCANPGVISGGSLGKKIKTGVFGADMKVELVNDGPVTILIDSKNRE